MARKGASDHSVDLHRDELTEKVCGRVLSAELDLDEIIRGKLDLDVTGHYARADIFDLAVRDERR